MSSRKSNIYDSVAEDRLLAYLGEWSGEFFERFEKGKPKRRQRFEIVLAVTPEPLKRLCINAELAGMIKGRLVRREVEVVPTRIGRHYFRMDFNHKDKGQDHFGAFIGNLDPDVESARGSYISWGWDHEHDAMGTFELSHVFRRVKNLVDIWKPDGCRTEKQHEESLFTYLKKRLVAVKIDNQRRKEHSRVDILVGKLTQLELKCNLEQQSEYDRLVGQMMKVKDSDRFFIAVLTGITAKGIAEQLDERVKQLNKDVGRTRFAVVVKSLDHI